MSRKPASNHGFKKSLDLIELSDAFRRHASYSKPDLVQEMVKEARQFAALSTWYDPAETFRHQDLSEKLSASVKHISELAVKLGVDQIELPVSGNQHSPFAKFFEKKVLPKLELPVKITLQKSEYSKDLSDVGRIDKRVRTALDEGLRGVADIKAKLKHKW